MTNENLKQFTLMIHYLGILEGMDAFCLWRQLMIKMENG